MEIAIQILSILLDIYILRAYLIGIMPKYKESISKIWFYSGIIITEILLQFNTSLNVNFESAISMITTNILSIVTTFALCFFFESKTIYNIAASVILQILVLLSESVCVLFFVAMYDSSLLNGYEYEIKMNLMSKIILLIMVLFLALLRKNNKDKPAVYSISILFTPVISLAVLMAMPLNNNYLSDNLSFFSIVWIYIALIIIIHSILMERLSDRYITQMYASDLEKQVIYQKEKYLQLSESYKTGRRIIHDIKHQNEVLKKYIAEERYDALYDYLSSYTDALESTYVRVNTGNLVIDALLTNYGNIASTRKISFTTNLRIDNSRIPISDYDLCTILGNLLDNSFHACEDFPPEMAKISISITSDKSDQFIIVVTNSYDNNIVKKSKDFPNHGYGLANIKKAVEAYNGLMKVETGEMYKTLISIPITKISQRFTHPTFSDGK